MTTSDYYYHINISYSYRYNFDGIVAKGGGLRELAYGTGFRAREIHLWEWRRVWAERLVESHAVQHLSENIYITNVETSIAIQLQSGRVR